MGQLIQLYMHPDYVWHEVCEYCGEATPESLVVGGMCDACILELGEDLKDHDCFNPYDD